MRRKMIPALLLALALLLTACSPASGEGEPSPAETEPAVTDTAPEESPEASPEGTPAEPEEPEEPEDLGPWMEDWDLFWRTLEENYPYEGVLYRTTGKTLTGLEKQFRYVAKRAESAEDLLRGLRSISGMFDHIGHMMVFNADAYASKYGSALRSPETNLWSQYYAELLGSEQSRSVYHWSEEEGGSSTSDVGGSSRGSAAEASDNLTFAYYPEQSAAYVEVRSMLGYRSDGYDRDQQLLLDFFQTIEEEGYENCIIDIRRNGGGDSSYAQLLLMGPNLTGDTEVIGQTHYMLIKGGQETMDYYDAKKLILSNFVPELYPIEELDLDSLPALEREDLEGITYYSTAHMGMWNEPLDAPAFSGRSWLLVSPWVYSASEEFAIICKDTGFATLVGQSTGGDGIGGAPMICVLPNSGIAYQFSIENGLNLDGSSNEEMGTQPDIVVPEGEDALEVCLRAIEEGR